MPQMRILLTNIVLSQRTGTEVVVEQLMDGLRRDGHIVAAYAPTLGPLAAALRERGHLVVSKISELPWRPSVIHGQHNVSTMTALAAFPEVPAIYYCHDASAPFDAPPIHPALSHYLAVDSLCRSRIVSAGVAADCVSLLLNAVDELRYDKTSTLHIWPQRALALTKHDTHLPAVCAACQRAGLSLDELGPAGGRVTGALESELPSYDIVFATARMALEAAFSGCAVVVCDGRGFAGMLTTRNLRDWRGANFGRQILSRPCTEELLWVSISSYDSIDAAAVSAEIRKSATLSAQIESLTKIYARATARSVIDPDRAAMAIASFFEDHAPTLSLDRQWQGLVKDVAGRGLDVVAPLAATFRDDILDAIKPPSLRAGSVRGGRFLSPSRFRTQLARKAGDALTAVFADTTEVVVFGPYIQLFPNWYDAEFDVEWTDCNPGPDGQIYFDVTATPPGRPFAVLSRLAFQPPGQTGAGGFIVRFEHSDPMAALEFRVGVQAFQRGELRFRGVTIRKVDLA
jgi:hypothetical protein